MANPRIHFKVYYRERGKEEEALMLQIKIALGGT